jgi:hypothetical protein
MGTKKIEWDPMLSHVRVINYKETNQNYGYQVRINLSVRRGQSVRNIDSCSTATAAGPSDRAI